MRRYKGRIYQLSTACIFLFRPVIIAKARFCANKFSSKSKMGSVSCLRGFWHFFQRYRPCDNKRVPKTSSPSILRRSNTRCIKFHLEDEANCAGKKTVIGISCECVWVRVDLCFRIFFMHNTRKKSLLSLFCLLAFFFFFCSEIVQRTSPDEKKTEKCIRKRRETEMERAYSRLIILLGSSSWCMKSRKANEMWDWNKSCLVVLVLGSLCFI